MEEKKLSGIRITIEYSNTMYYLDTDLQEADYKKVTLGGEISWCTDPFKMFERIIEENKKLIRGTAQQSRTGE